MYRVKDDYKIKVGEDRDIKFDRELRYNRHENYDITNYELTRYRFQTGDKDVYKNANFSIFVSDKCNANCKFCVAQLRYEDRNLLYKKKKIEDKQEYLSRLKEVLETVCPLNPSVSLTGGEPTLDIDFLRDILGLVREYKFRKITLTTNGLTLDSKLIALLTYVRLKHLNISIPHYNSTVNAKIMNISVGEADNLLRRLRDNIRTLKAVGISPRVSCLLSKEGISDISEIRKFIDCFYDNCGVDNFIFRQMMQYDNTAINQSVIKYCNDNSVDLIPIWENMEKSNDFIPYLNLIGYYYYVEIYKYRNNITVASESADLKQQRIEKNNHSDIVYEMVFHPNGNLCGSWIDSEDILSAYQK